MRIVATVVAVLAHLVVGVFYLSSGLVAPMWAVVALLVLWVLLAAALGVLATRGSYAVIGVPILAAVVWVAAVSAGGAWLGWTA